MKKIFKLILIGVSVAVIAPACSIEKRVHNPGYHITWNALKSSSNGIENAENADATKNQASTADSKVQTSVAQSILNNSAATHEVKPNAQAATKIVPVVTKNPTVDAPIANKKSPNHQGLKTVVKAEAAKKAVRNVQANDSDDELILLYLLAIFIPFVAVGIVTDWDLTDVVINLLLSLLCYIPGVIHAFIKIRDNR